MMLIQIYMIFIMQSKVSSNHHTHQAIYFDDFSPPTILEKSILNAHSKWFVKAKTYFATAVKKIIIRA